jgi:hypothetical protein
VYFIPNKVGRVRCLGAFQSSRIFDHDKRQFIISVKVTTSQDLMNLRDITQMREDQGVKRSLMYNVNMLYKSIIVVCLLFTLHV